MLTEKMLQTFFDEKEIYQYTISVLQDYKEFKEEVINHLKFLKKKCESGLQKNDVMALNGISNYITSFLIRNHLIDNKI